MGKKTRKEKQQEKVESSSLNSVSIPQKSSALNRDIRNVFWAIIGLTTLVFIPSLWNEFVLWDDPEYVYENPFFKDFSFSTVFSLDTFYMGNYHPLTILWLYWESLLFSNGDPEVYNGFQPFWFHLNNLILHVANTALVFFFVKEFLGTNRWKVAGIAAVLFGIHPMHVESVAWVTEIKDVLYGVFFLGAILAYVRYQNSNSVKYIVIALILFTLSLLSKAQGVTLPVIFVLMDWYKSRKFTIAAMAEKIPFFALSIFFGLLAIKAQKAESAINPNFEGIDTIFYGSYGILAYIFKMFLPIGFSGAHPYPSNPVFEPLPGYFKLLPLGVIILGAATWFFGRRNKIILFGMLFYLITVSIVLKFVPVGDTIIAERYTYIPYIGLFIIIGSLANKLLELQNYRKMVSYSLIGIVAVLSIASWQRSMIWKNTFTFWNDVSEKYPNYWRGYNCVGQEYLKMGTIAAKNGNQELAQQHYQSALNSLTASCENDKWAPPIPYMVRGALYVDNLKDYDKAIADFKKVISFPNPNDPTQIEARYNLGLAYIRTQQFENAVAILNEGINRNPSNPRGHYFMGLALAGAKNYQQAEKAYTQAITVNANYTAAYLNRGVLYTDQLNLPAKGIEDFKEVLSRQPQNRDAMINIGICLFKLNRSNDAIRQYNNCLQLMPNNGRIFYLRALALAQNGSFNNAYLDGKKASELGMKINQAQLNGWKQKAGV